MPGGRELQKTLCSKHLDSLPEVLNCTKLKYEVQSLQKETQYLISQTIYEDIFSDILKQKQATNTYTLLLKLREQLLETNFNPPGSTPCTSPAPDVRAMLNCLIWRHKHSVYIWEIHIWEESVRM